MSKFKIVFIILLIATIIWGIVFYYVLQEYHKFVEGVDPFLRKWGLQNPWWMWNGMPYIVTAGMFLFVAWFFFIGYFLSEKVYPYIKKRFKPAVNPLEACYRLALIEGQKENKNTKKEGA